VGVCLQGRALCSVRTLPGGCVLAGSSLPTFPTSMVLKGLFSLSTQGKEGGKRGRGDRKGREGGERGKGEREGRKSGYVHTAVSSVLVASSYNRVTLHTVKQWDWLAHTIGDLIH